ncbi:MAG TPA: glycosyltransferase family 9 protein [Puia sp.]|nr:glycosyltransferase family 9 protein [Puia sp.]
MKFLIIRFSSIGDIVLTTPVIRCVKKQVENAEVHFLTKKSFKAVTESNPYIDKFFYYDDDLDELIKELKKEKYDYIIDLHKNIRSYKIRFALRCKTLSYKKESVQKFLLTKLRINTMSGRHIVLRNLDAVRSLGVMDDGFGLNYFVTQKDNVRVEDLPASHSMGYVAIVIGASYFTKKLPIYKLREICSKLNYPIVLVGGKEDVDEGNAVAEIDNVKIYNACGKFNLNESADIVRKAKLVISHDTGLQYIASAFNKPTLAIWGGTSPKLDVEPFYGSRFLATQEKIPYKNILVTKLSCQPCSNFGRKKCPLGHFKCMHLQDVDLIVKEAEEKLRIDNG